MSSNSDSSIRGVVFVVLLAIQIIIVCSNTNLFGLAVLYGIGLWITLLVSVNDGDIQIPATILGLGIVIGFVCLKSDIIVGLFFIHAITIIQFIVIWPMIEGNKSAPVHTHVHHYNRCRCGKCRPRK